MAERNDVFEEPLEERQAEALADARQARVLGQRFIQAIAQIPAVGEVQAGCLDQAALQTNPLEEHDELQLEEHDGVDRRPAARGVEIAHPLADKAQVQLSVEAAVEVISRDEVFERDRDGLIERAELWRTQHGRHPNGGAEEHQRPRQRLGRARRSGPEST